MPRYAAFLRGISPMNAKMPELRRAFEVAGFTNVVKAYVPTPKGAAFMAVIEKALGKDITTRTWDTVGKVARK